MACRRNKRLRLLAHHPFCFWCEVKLTEASATLEHIVPRSRGGADNIENLVLACTDCNPERGAPDVSEDDAKEIYAEYLYRAGPLPEPKQQQQMDVARQKRIKLPRGAKSKPGKPWRGSGVLRVFSQPRDRTSQVVCI